MLNSLVLKVYVLYFWRYPWHLILGNLIKDQDLPQAPEMPRRDRRALEWTRHHRCWGQRENCINYGKSWDRLSRWWKPLPHSIPSYRRNSMAVSQRFPVVNQIRGRQFINLILHQVWNSRKRNLSTLPSKISQSKNFNVLKVSRFWSPVPALQSKVWDESWWIWHSYTFWYRCNGEILKQTAAQRFLANQRHWI